MVPLRVSRRLTIVHISIHPNQFIFQHSPSNQEEAKHVCKMLCFSTWKRLCEKVSSHVLSRAINKFDRAVFNRIADEMPPNVNIFCAGMKLPFQVGKCNCGLIIQVKNDGVFE